MVYLTPRLPTEGTFLAQCVDEGMQVPPMYWAEAADGNLWWYLASRELFERLFEAGFEFEVDDPEDYKSYRDSTIHGITKEVSLLVVPDSFYLSLNEDDPEWYPLGGAPETARRARLRELFRLQYAGFAKEAFRSGEKWRKLRIARLRSAGRKTGVAGLDIPAAPVPRLGTVTPAEAEEIVAQWVRRLGDSGVVTTSFSRDGGIDVKGDYTVSQVKHYTGAVSVSDIRALYGVAISMEKLPLFFTSGHYTSAGLSFARQNLIPLFQYDATLAKLKPESQEARRLMSLGVERYCGGELKR